MITKASTLNTDELKALVTLIANRGGSITARGLQHAARRYRRSATDARAALDSLAVAGLAEWDDAQTLRLTDTLENGCMPLETPEDPPWVTGGDSPAAAEPAVETTTEQSSQNPGNQDTEVAPTVMATVLPVIMELAATVTPAVTAVTNPVTAVATEGVVTARTDEPAEGEAEHHRASETRAEATNRWVREGRKVEADNHREQVRLECLAGGMSRFDANQRAWESAIAAFPPPGQVAVELPAMPADEPQGAPSSVEASATDAGHLQGLGRIPSAWGTLPANASLQAEISWVQANRLVVVEERSSGATVVHLDRARSPAPSWAALGWLETSIRSYAKYVDVVARSLANAQDEADDLRRERLALEEIDELLAQMGDY